MRSRAQFSFTLDSERKAKDFFKVLNLESKSDSRVQTALSIKGAVLSLSIKTRDRNALRSAVNSYGRWIKLYEEIGGIR